MEKRSKVAPPEITFSCCEREVLQWLAVVLQQIFRAANDTGATLRYPAGADSVAGAKMRAELSEEDFLASKRQAYAVPPQ